MPRRLKTRRLQVRPAGAEDHDALRELLGGAPGDMAAPGIAGEIAPSALRQLLQSAAVEDNRQLLVLETRKPLGAVGLLLARLHHPWPGTAFIELLLLAAAVRGLGYGREACEAWQAWAVRRERIREFQAAVRLGDGPAAAFWAALGYRDTGEVRRDDSGRSFRILARRSG